MDERPWFANRGQILQALVATVALVFGAVNACRLSEHRNCFRLGHYCSML
jgi:hypothetical protein